MFMNDLQKLRLWQLSTFVLLAIAAAEGAVIVLREPPREAAECDLPQALRDEMKRLNITKPGC